jgi:hypothetical protein
MFHKLTYLLVFIFLIILRRYRESGEWEILVMNWNLYKKVAEADAVPGAPPTKGRAGQVGAIRSTDSPAVSLGELPKISKEAQ